MTNKCALYISRSDMSPTMVEHGYVDALRHLGWTVYVCDPKTKQGCRKLIEKYGVRLILTHSKYGVRQLPIDIINSNNVGVAVCALPFSKYDTTECSHDDELTVLGNIRLLVVHTHLQPRVWPDYMREWTNSDLNFIHIPFAGNIIRAMPPNFDQITDVGIVANFSQNRDAMKQFIKPLFTQLQITDHSYQAFGDGAWQEFGISHNGPLSDVHKRLSHIYGTAGVCPNVHTTRHRKTEMCVNDRVFMIPLCGGIQVVDSLLAKEFLGENVSVATTPSQFVSEVFRLFDCSDRIGKIKNGVEFVSHNHTYFNRLMDIFGSLGLDEHKTETETVGKRVATRHCWGIMARLDAQERGIAYEDVKITAT